MGDTGRGGGELLKKAMHFKVLLVRWIGSGSEVPVMAYALFWRGLIFVDVA